MTRSAAASLLLLHLFRFFRLFQGLATFFAHFPFFGAVFQLGVFGAHGTVMGARSAAVAGTNCAGGGAASAAGGMGRSRGECPGGRDQGGNPESGQNFLQIFAFHRDSPEQEKKSGFLKETPPK